MGQYPTNSHDTPKQIMRKFLANQKIRTSSFPPETTQELLTTLNADITEERGTLQAVGQDIEAHANLALAETPGDVDFTIQAPTLKPDLALRKERLEFLSNRTLEIIQQLYHIMFPNADDIIVNKRLSKFDSVTYLGECFKSDNGDTVNCNTIRAKWLKSGYDLDIDLGEQ